MTFTGINYFAVLVSTVVYYFIGFVWYSVLFKGQWAAQTGVSAGKPSAGSLIGQFISTLLYAFGIAIILSLYGSSSVTAGIYVGILVTVFFVIPINSGNLFFTGKKKLFLLDVCERAIGSLAIGIILGIWE